MYSLDSHLGCPEWLDPDLAEPMRVNTQKRSNSYMVWIAVWDLRCAPGRLGSLWHVYVCTKLTKDMYFPGCLPNGRPVGKYMSLWLCSSQRQRHLAACRGTCPMAYGSEIMSDLISFVSSGCLFCPGLDQAIFELRYTVPPP